MLKFILFRVGPQKISFLPIPNFWFFFDLRTVPLLKGNVELFFDLRIVPLLKGNVELLFNLRLVPLLKGNVVLFPEPWFCLNPFFGTRDTSCGPLISDIASLFPFENRSKRPSFLDPIFIDCF